jgi:protein-S-isoprenylcysteine O-methyltransferase Ste14
LPIFGGLDFRLEWSKDLSLEAHLIGVLLYFLGGLLFAWAMAVNAKFATIVRVGEEGTHPVAMEGPYRIVRHPGYLGFCFQAIGLPLLFGTWWGYILSAVGIIAVVIRTALEDKTLQAELTGYYQLVMQTRFRLFPGIW